MSSVASKNLFAILSEDVEVAPVAKKVAPKAEPAAPIPGASRPARSNKKPAASGNEAAFKDRNNGRNANRAKSTDGPAPANRRQQKNPRPDRHSQTGKVDTAKRVNKGWGDNKKKGEDEVAAEEIAKTDAAEAAAEEAKPVEEVDTSVTLEQYFEELKIKAAETESNKQIRQANEGADEGKWKTKNALDKKEQESFVAASKSKTLKSKTKKEKTLLDLNLSFGSPSGERGNDRRNDRRGNNGGNKRGGDRKPRNTAAASIKTSDANEFPVLGA